MVHARTLTPPMTIPISSKSILMQTGLEIYLPVDQLAVMHFWQLVALLLRAQISKLRLRFSPAKLSTLPRIRQHAKPRGYASYYTKLTLLRPQRPYYLQRTRPKGSRRFL